MTTPFPIGPICALANAGLAGEAAAPGDKSISHRALILGARATGETRIRGLLDGDDVLRTAAALRELGAEIEKTGDVWTVRGGVWRDPDRILYLGNSGTGARLLMGAVAGAGVAAIFDGDASLRARPMGRVLEPLRMMGADAESHDGKLPVRISRAGKLRSLSVKLATPSAQVKSAILLAGLGAEGVTTVHEPVLTRDHTERMLAAFGVALDFQDDGAGGRFIRLGGRQPLVGCEVSVPGDPSSAAFPIAAALITPRSDVLIKNVLINPGRSGFYETLREMGADISFENSRTAGGERVADIRARTSRLTGVEVPESRAPSMIDEYPILSVVAAFAQGDTVMRGIGELRIKETDRIGAMEQGLAAAGVDVDSGEDWLRIRGGDAVAGGVAVKTLDDHRIAMSFLVLSLAAEEAIEIDDPSMIATSFPSFFGLMEGLGAAFRPT